jgi:hypothetical protein
MPKAPSRHTAIAVAVLAASTTAWTALQCVLSRANGIESAKASARGLAQMQSLAAARGLTVPSPQPAETGVSFWGPLVQANTVQIVALAVLALVFVMSGRRLSWVVLTPLVFVRPVAAGPVLSWLRPVGFAWNGPWILYRSTTDAAFFGRQSIGTAVDVLVIVLPAVVYLLLTRRAGRPLVAPAATVVRRLSLPIGLAVATSVTYGLANLNGGDFERTLPVFLVPLAAGLLSTTPLGLPRSILVVAATAFLASPASLDLTHSQPLGTASGYLSAFALLAVVGALVGVQGPAIASAYRRFVRRPVVAAQLPA